MEQTTIKERLKSQNQEEKICSSNVFIYMYVHIFKK